MANKTLFSSIKSILPRTNATNEAGGRAYRYAPKHALAQLAATGCFNGTFYASGESQLNELRTLIDQVDDDVFLAKLAVYASERAFMKDMPAALVCALSTRDTELMHRVFDRVIDNGRVLRTLFQMVRSGQFGRNSLSSSLQLAFQRWLNNASVGKLLSVFIGNVPSLSTTVRKRSARRKVAGGGKTERSDVHSLHKSQNVGFHQQPENGCSEGQGCSPIWRNGLRFAVACCTAR